LKPDVFPPRRRSVGSTVPALTFSRKRRGTLPCEMIKPNLIASHDWHVQPICQRSLRAIRLSETPWIEGRTCVRLSSNLVRNTDFPGLQSRLQRFGANFSRLSNKQDPVKLNLSGTNAVSPFALRKFSMSGQQKLPEPVGLAGDSAPGSCNGMFSPGNSLQGLREGLQPASTNPTNRLPTSLNSCIALLNQGRPANFIPGHREAPLLSNNLIRVAQGGQRCKRHGTVNRLYLQQAGNFLLDPPEFAPNTLWKPTHFYVKCFAPVWFGTWLCLRLTASCSVAQSLPRSPPFNASESIPGP
jgi:hypothetical protein